MRRRRRRRSGSERIVNIERSLQSRRIAVMNAFFAQIQSRHFHRTKMKRKIVVVAAGALLDAQTCHTIATLVVARALKRTIRNAALKLS